MIVLVFFAGAEGLHARPGSLDFAFVPGDEISYELTRENKTRNATQAMRVHLSCFDIPAPDKFTVLLTLESVGPHSAVMGGFSAIVSRNGETSIPLEMVNDVANMPWMICLLPPLPPTELDQQWTSPADAMGDRWHGARAGRDASHANQPVMDFVRSDITGVQECGGASLRARIWFDETQRLVSQAGLEYIEAITHDQYTLTFHLSERQRRKPAWAAQRARELEAYIRALRLERYAVDDLTDSAASAAPALQSAEKTFGRVARLWEEFDYRIAGQVSPLAQLAASHRAGFVQRGDLMRQRARFAHECVAAPAAQWSLQAPGGQIIQSESLRNRPVLECLWRSDSEESLRTFETLRELRTAVPEAQLAIVCLCLDSDPSQLNRIAASCGHDLLQLHSGPPLSGQQPAEVPILRLLDTVSTTRFIRIGWRPGLAQEVKAALESIKKKPARAVTAPASPESSRRP